jgi:hypothetical protein
MSMGYTGGVSNLEGPWVGGSSQQGAGSEHVLALGC